MMTTLSHGLRLFGGSTVLATGVTGITMAAIPDIATASGWIAMVASGASIMIISVGGALLKVRKDIRDDQRKWQVENEGTLAGLLAKSEQENHECQAERQALKEDLGTVKEELHDYRRDFLELSKLSKDFIELSKLIAANRGSIARFELHEKGADQ